MRTFFYHGALRKSIIQFLDIFNDITIAKYNADGSVKEYVEVPLRYMPKQKYYIWLNDRKKEKRYPSIGVELTSIAYDQARVSGSMQTITISGSDSLTYTSNPVPYNLSFTLHIATEYQHEMDQINEQLLPFFNPHVVTTVVIDDLDLEWDMEVFLEDASIEVDPNMDVTDVRGLIWTHGYLVKTFMVRPSSTISTVKKVIHNFFLTEESLARVDTTTDLPSGQGAADEELLIIGYKEDGEIMAKYLLYGDNI